MCGCSSNNSVKVVNIAPRIISQPTNCDVTLEQVLATKQNLLDNKTPLNSSYINSQLGLIETMINHGNYCFYDLNNMRL